MNISISQFLQTADPAILDRGRDYFRNGHVISFEEIRRMIKLGARKRVNELILSLRREYPKRRALLEELNKT